MVYRERPSPLQQPLPMVVPVFNYLIEDPIIIENGLNAIRRSHKATAVRPTFEYLLPGFQQLIAGKKHKRFNAPKQDELVVPDRSLGRNGRIEDALHKVYGSSRIYDSQNRGVEGLELNNNHQIALRGLFRHDHIGPPMLTVDLGDDYYQYEDEQPHRQDVARITADLMLRRLVYVEGSVVFDARGLQPARPVVDQ